MNTGLVGKFSSPITKLILKTKQDCNEFQQIAFPSVMSLMAFKFLNGQTTGIQSPYKT